MLQEAKKKETGHIHVNFMAGEGGRKEGKKAGHGHDADSSAVLH